MATYFPAPPEPYIETGTYFPATRGYPHPVMWPVFRSAPVLARSVILLALAAGTVAVDTKSAVGQMLFPSPALRQAEYAPGKQRPDRANAHRVSSTFDLGGISSLTCEGTVDWETLLGGRTSSNFREQVLPILKGTRFLVTIDRNGIASIAARRLVPPASGEAATRAEGAIQTFSGVIAAVLQGWARFAMTADLPPAADEYQLDDSGDHYLVAFRNGPADVAISLDRTYILDESILDENTLNRNSMSEADLGEIAAIEHQTDAESRSNAADSAHFLKQAQPSTALSPAHFLITDWAVAFPRGGGRPLTVAARYMQVGGIAVPAEMTLHSSLPAFGEITLPLSLNNYQFQR